MHKRRQIREAATQFLYLADLEEGPDASGAQDAFWQIVQESSIRKLTKARAKAILHIAQGRESRMVKLSERLPLVLAELKVVDGTADLTSALKKINAQESKLSAALDRLKTINRSKSDDSGLEAQLTDVINTNKSLAALRQNWRNALADFPVWKNKLEDLTANITHLGRVSERLEAIDSPEGLPGLEHLRSSKEEIIAFQKDTEALIQGTLSNKENIDTKLVEIVENYAPERVAPVDRAILRIGAYEILYCDDIPTAVSINEAIEIAKKFGGTDSPRFINGVLDSLGK